MKYANQFQFHPKVPKSAFAHLSNALKGEQDGQEVSSNMATAQREVLIEKSWRLEREGDKLPLEEVSAETSQPVQIH